MIPVKSHGLKNDIFENNWFDGVGQRRFRSCNSRGPNPSLFWVPTPMGDEHRRKSGTEPIILIYDPSEHKIQSKLVDILPPLLKPGVVRLAIPNGGLRHPIVGKMLKEEGLEPGSPDLVFALHDGLTAWLEMKKRKGVLSDVQIGMIAKLKRLGHPIGVAYSVDEALDWLNDMKILR